jgi:hypothetical protein
VIAVTAGLLTGACGAPSPQHSALSACKSYLAAGLGNPGTSPKAWKGRLADGVKQARRAATDRRWARLAAALTAVQAQQERAGYAVPDHPTDADYAERETVVEECQVAGLGP